MSSDWMRLTEDPIPWRAPSPLPGAIRTERLVIRIYEKGDGPRLFAAIAADRSALLPWMAWARTDHLDVEDSVHYVEGARRRVASPNCTDFPMGIFDRTTGDLVGGTGLHRIVPGTREAEIGYWIRGDRQAEGLGTEAAAALISGAFRPIEDGGWGFRRILIGNAAPNLASRRICQKLGLRLERRERQAAYLGPIEDGAPGYHDHLFFAVLSTEWDADAHRALPGIAWDESL